MHTFSLIAFITSFVLMAVAALGLNRALTPPAGYHAAILGIVGFCMMLASTLVLLLN